MSTTLDTYRKVKALAERGATEGERTAARAALERIERKNPDLKLLHLLPDLQPFKASFDFTRYWT